MKTNLNQEILSYLDGLSSKNKDFEYFPINGINKLDSLPRLGFSCYALKIYKLLNFKRPFTDQCHGFWEKENVT